MLRYLPLILLAGCAPAHLTQAKAVVDSRSEYVYYTGWVKPQGIGENQGNCAWYSLQYASQLRRMGYSAPNPTLCRVPDGTGHAVLDVDGYRLDNRLGYVIKTTESDCK